MTYRSIHGTSPSYLQSCFTRVSDMTSRRRLRSSTSHRLDVPRVRLSSVGRQAFPVSGATVWNDLPLHVASAPSLAVFRQRLKTFLFSRSYHMTRMLLSPFIWTPVVLAPYLGHKCLWWWWWWIPSKGFYCFKWFSRSWWVPVKSLHKSDPGMRVNLHIFKMATSETFNVPLRFNGWFYTL